MQLLIYGNSTTSKNYIQGDQSLVSTSFKVKSKNDAYAERCDIRVRGKYAMGHKVMDQETRQHLAKQLTDAISKVKTQAKYHTTLHIYAHGSTFGLGFKKKKEEGRLFLAPEILGELLLPYLINHPECTKVKLHVCFTGMDYSGTTPAYADLLVDALKTNVDQLKQKSLLVEGVNGLSVLDSDDNSHHALYPSKEIEKDFVKTDKQHQYIVDNSLGKKRGKPTWAVI